MTILSDGPSKYQLQASERAALLDLARTAADQFSGINQPRILDEVAARTLSLPAKLLEYLRNFQSAQSAGGALIQGIALDPSPGPTPSRWDPAHPTFGSAVADFTVLLIGMALGHVFGWRCLQDGQLVHNVLPVPGHEHNKSGLSSQSTLDLHTEDACHPARADYLVLLCLRNDDMVPTIYADLTHAKIEPHTAAILAEPRFQMALEPDHHGEPTLSKPIRVISGAPAKWRLRFDELYVTAVPDDFAASAALDQLTRGLTSTAVNIVLREGDLLILDNNRAVHGRPPFVARYDGQDRWLKRAHITLNLARSRPWRINPTSPIIETCRVNV